MRQRYADCYEDETTVGLASDGHDRRAAHGARIEFEDAIGASGLPPSLGRRTRVEQELPVDAFLVPRDVAVAEHHHVGVGEPSMHAAGPTLPRPTVVARSTR